MSRIRGENTWPLYKQRKSYFWNDLYNNNAVLYSVNKSIELPDENCEIYKGTDLRIF